MGGAWATGIVVTNLTYFSNLLGYEGRAGHKPQSNTVKMMDSKSGK